MQEAVMVMDSTLRHSVRVYQSDADYAAVIDINNRIDMHLDNKEFVMRIKSDIRNGNDEPEFFTDLNGFQMRRRRTLKKIPMGGNMFPMPSAAFLQDATTRMSLHTHSAMGVAGMEQGWLETVLDRRLMGDDNRGLQQGVTDNHLTNLQYSLLLEPIKAPREEHPNLLVEHPSLTARATFAGDRLNHPLVTMVSTSDATPRSNSVAPLTAALDCDVHVLNIRSMGPPTPDGLGSPVAVVFHRRGMTCGPVPMGCSDSGTTHLMSMFEGRSIKSLKRKTLTLNDDASNSVSATAEVALSDAIPVMEMAAFEFEFS